MSRGGKLRQRKRWRRFCENKCLNTISDIPLLNRDVMYNFKLSIIIDGSTRGGGGLLGWDHGEEVVMVVGEFLPFFAAAAAADDNTPRSSACIIY